MWGSFSSNVVLPFPKLHLCYSKMAKTWVDHMKWDAILFPLLYCWLLILSELVSPFGYSNSVLSEGRELIPAQSQNLEHKTSHTEEICYFSFLNSFGWVAYFNTAVSCSILIFPLFHLPPQPILIKSRCSIVLQALKLNRLNSHHSFAPC